MPINSCLKGKKGERLAAKLINDLFPGAEARRGQQFKGTPDSPDVISNLPGVHIEIKNAQRMMPYGWLKQTELERGVGEVGLVMMKRNNLPWLVCCYANELPQLVRNLHSFMEGSDASAVEEDR
jgi:hypothetical protein